MNIPEAVTMRSIESQLAEHQKRTWIMVGAVVLAGFVGLHFLVSRPLTCEIARLQSDLAQIEQRVQSLVGTGKTVSEANSLLASLESQQSEIEGARQSLQAMRDLRSDLIEEGLRNEA